MPDEISGMGKIHDNASLLDQKMFPFFEFFHEYVTIRLGNF
jgi:hypothetical protein